MYRRFETGDFEQIVLQAEQKDEAEVVLEEQPNAYSFLVNGKVVAVCWFREIYEGRYETCAYISADIGTRMLLFVRELKRVIEEKAKEVNAVRVEMTVLDGFEQGDRLAKLLGYEYEGTMRKVYRGLNYKLYARLFQ